MSSMRLPVLFGMALLLGTSVAGGAQTTSATTLEERVRMLQDKDEIREVLIRYGEYLDAKDYAGYASLFASNGTWTGGLGSGTGPAGIQAMLEKGLGKPEAGYVNKNSYHLMTTEVIKVTGDTANVRSRYLFLTATPENRPQVLLAGRYVDQFVREKGEWKILRRTSHGVLPWRDGNAPPPPPPPGLQDAAKK